MIDKDCQSYPFRLGTTSFIYPADYAANVRRLAPRLDEIELLLFESTPLPSRDEIETLSSLAQKHDTTFNVHLPMDISMGNRSESRRSESVRDVARAMDRVAPLRPTTQTLHLTCDEPQMNGDARSAWQDRTMQSVEKLIDITRVAPRNLSVETLEYDPRWLSPMVSGLDLSVCVDAGHVIRYGYDLAAVLEMYAERITILHLHGVKNGEDHHAIVHLEPEIKGILARFMAGFGGTISIEVFSQNRLEQSLDAFPGLMAHARQ